MDKYKVTNAEYAVFLNAKGKHVEEEISFDLKDSDAWIEYVGEYVGDRYQAKFRGRIRESHAQRFSRPRVSFGKFD